MLISKNEVCNSGIVQLGALLHDIADSKFHEVTKLLVQDCPGIF
jgi:HD superfamily phosphodiesterase